MTKRALSAVAGFLSICFPLFAQQTDFAALNNSFLRLPSLTLSDGGLFSFSSAFTRMEMTTPDFLPALSMASTTARSQRATASAAPVNDSSKEVADMQRPNQYYAGGEMGVLYGRSSGKFGRDVEAGYILGEVGNDKFQITAGASYENSSGRVPRFGR
jgi:hypothetical protein